MSFRNAGDEAARGRDRQAAASGSMESLVASAVSKVRAGRTGAVTVDELMALRGAEPGFARDVLRLVQGSVQRFVYMHRGDPGRHHVISGMPYVLAGVESVHHDLLEATLAAIVCSFVVHGRATQAATDLLMVLIGAAEGSSTHEAVRRLATGLSRFRMETRDIIFQVMPLFPGEVGRPELLEARTLVEGFEEGVRWSGPVVETLRALTREPRQMRRNSTDDTLRALERLVATGDMEALERLKILRERAGRPLGVNIDDMLKGYLEAALWSGVDDSDGDDNGEEFLDATYDIDDFTPEAIASARADIEKFAWLNEEDLLEATGLRVPTEYWSDSEQHGHDFLLTRNHSGAGFWDRGYGDVGKRLTKAAEEFNEVRPYVMGDQVDFE